MDSESRHPSDEHHTPPGNPGVVPTATSSDIGQLIQRVVRRDRSAFAQLYEATAPKLLGTVMRIVRDRAWADDVIQDAYIKVWQKAGQYDAAKASPIAWMASIARNSAIDELRKQPARRSMGDEEIDEIASVQPTAQAELEEQQAVNSLNSCIDELEKDRQDMVRLAYLNGWSRDELAAHFDQPVNTVKTWLHRALKQLKRCLAP
ncbi:MULTISPECIES: sigma-70 family RNA polymerase sigma factor [Marinobacter]|uniref:sigma-70 family RNA polymerase sigma factor n=1 Tax=Marinobacter TaxID=2742 RepID=UPI00200470F6|nr:MULTISPECIES: sigma-70 family RNA polymerase sigma factor [Marinobacter]MCK7551345.1 sigma-70 family RNA polymerase sigma factor [Marinobacter goseongensis]MDV3504887.1 sigma-70 family RNA polymerase sigma factor [Marinobacter sp. M-5]